MIVLDDNEKLLINEVRARGSNQWWNYNQCKQFRYTKPSICYNERVKKVHARRFVTFYVLLGSSTQYLLSVGIRSYFTQGDVCRKIRQMYLFIVQKYFSLEVTHKLQITLMNSTLSKSFSVNFIHFKQFLVWCL